MRERQLNTMKIEMGESLGYSFLRHVKRCWLAQANWKASEHWEKQVSDDELENTFRSMRQTFDLGGSVFKGTKDCAQFIRQAEIDVVGVGQDGSIHAIDVAFHEAGLNYGGGVGNRVLKKLLRTVLVLMAYHPPEVQKHIYFVSPKVHRAAQQTLEDILDRLRDEYPAIEWYLFSNEAFTQEVLVPTLEKGESVADTSELFLRSHKLLQMMEQPSKDIKPSGKTIEPECDELFHEIQFEDKEAGGASTSCGSLQDIVRGLMTILLEDYPSLIDKEDIRNMQDGNYCRDHLGLKLGDLELLRPVDESREVSGHQRFWARKYGNEFYVSNNWWAAHHVHNARKLQAFVSGIIHRNGGHPGVPILQQHWHELNDFISRNQ